MAVTLRIDGVQVLSDGKVEMAFTILVNTDELLKDQVVFPSIDRLTIAEVRKMLQDRGTSLKDRVKAARAARALIGQEIQLEA